MKLNKTCKVCGTRYAYCDGCLEFAHLEPWHNLFHDENCRAIFHMATDYQAGLLSKESAQEIILQCDLSKQDQFAPAIKKIIAELLAEPESPVEAVAEVKIVEEPKKVRNRKRNRLSEDTSENIE